MIVTQLLGGLGNQLFQYSMGRVLAEKHRVPLKLDITAFGEYRLRSYALEHFRIQAELLKEDEAKHLRIITPSRRLVAGLQRLIYRQPIFSMVESSFRFDPTALEARPPCYVKGYWQSPRYFESIEHLIRQELTVASSLAGKNAESAARIRSTPIPVSVHVRRGDYVTNAQVNRYHGTCEPDYYHAAEKRLLSSVSDIKLFIFSDDHEWVRENLHFSSPAIAVTHNLSEHGHEDLRLMSMCHHHIIANSTLSWWGAWLCNYQRKVVIAPQKWFREGGHSTDDLIPKTWIRL